MRVVMRTIPFLSRLVAAAIPAVALALPAALTVLAAPQRALATPYTYSSFNVNVSDLNNIGSIALTGAPTGTNYTSYTVSLDWVPGTGDPWSVDAIWAIVSDPAPGSASSVFYADPGPSLDAQENGDPITLTWSGFFDTPYIGGDPAYFWFAENFDGSTATWNNVSITLDTTVPTPPDATAIGNPGTVTTTLAEPEEVSWFTLEYLGGALTIDTLGSNLGPDNDTEIGLYDVTGALIGTNDDIDFAEGNLLSQLNFAPGELTAGTYYIAVGSFNTTFGNAFNVTSNGENVGTIKLNVNIPAVTTVPEPGTMVPFALATAFPALGMVVRRRRPSSNA